MPKQSKKKLSAPPAKATTKTQQPAVKPSTKKLRAALHSVARKKDDYLTRRPHRSFRLTRRRDYSRTLNLPGYWSFSMRVWKILWTHKRLFGSVLLTYALLNAIFVGISSQDSYSQLSELLQDTGEEIFGGGWGQIGQAGLLLLSGVSGSFAPQLTEVQQVYAVLFVLLIWLTSVWLLRAILAGGRPKLRDAIYNAGAPIVPTALVFFAMVIQLAPLALAAIVLSVANSTGFVADGGAIAMLIWVLMALLALLSVYWATSTMVALVVVTLPGMYPWQAIRTAGDLVIGRRIRILLRLLWMIATLAVIWIFVMLVTILLDIWLKNLLPAIEGWPLVPFVISIITSFSTIWAATYVYLLYRKVVDDDARPA